MTAVAPTVAGHRVDPVAVGRGSDEEAGWVTLYGLIDTLGSDLLSIAVAPGGLATRVGIAHLYDPQEPHADYGGGVVLGIGLDPCGASTSVVVDAVAAQGARALVLKAREGLSPHVRATAEQAGLAIVTLSPDASWDQAHAFLRTVTTPLHSEAPRSTATPLGDLFRLANAVSALVGGPTTIEDSSSVVLAYSTGDGPVDAARNQTILGRRVPQEWLRKLREAGVFRRLLAEDEVVSFVDPDPQIRPRLALAVRARGEVLGFIWVAQGSQPFADGAAEALRQAANIAALHLIRHRNSSDVERSRRSETLRGVLQGHLPPESLREAVDLTARSTLTVVGLQVSHVNGVESALKLQELVDLVTLYCAAYRRNAAAVVVGETVYVLVADADRAAERPRWLANELVRRAQASLAVPVRGGVSRTSAELDQVTLLARQVDQALRVLAASPRLGSVASVDDVRSHAVLLELKEFSADRPELLQGKLSLLLDEDRRRGTSYVAVLRAYLDHFGDIPSAAAAVPCHTNTFRYRLRRLGELARIDLDDPDERLVLQVQLKLME